MDLNPVKKPPFGNTDEGSEVMVASSRKKKLAVLGLDHHDPT